MLNSTEHEILTAHTNENTDKNCFCFKSDVVFIMLINVKMPTIVGILTFISRINFMLSWVEHEKKIITSVPDLGTHPGAHSFC